MPEQRDRLKKRSCGRRRVGEPRAWTDRMENVGVRVPEEESR